MVASFPVLAPEATAALFQCEAKHGAELYFSVKPSMGRKLYFSVKLAWDWNFISVLT